MGGGWSTALAVPHPVGAITSTLRSGVSEFIPDRRLTRVPAGTASATASAAAARSDCCDHREVKVVLRRSRTMAQHRRVGLSRRCSSHMQPRETPYLNTGPTQLRTSSIDADRFGVYGVVPSPSAALKSVATSVPLPPLKLSAPDPPVSRSLPLPPLRLPSPAPPDRVSLPQRLPGLVSGHLVDDGLSD